MRARFFLPVALLTTCLVACAVGTTDATDDDGGGAGDDTTDAHATSDGAHDSGTSFDASSVDGGGGNDASDTDGGTTDSGADGGGNTISCASTDPCPGGVALGSVAGDESGSPVTSGGDTSAFLQLIVTESDSGPFAAGMKLHVDLTSPPGMNFDLFVHMGASPGAIECTAVTASSTNGAGQADSVDLSWGESGTFANGTDDTRTVTIEVRQISGTCQTGVSWSVSAHGD